MNPGSEDRAWAGDLAAYALGALEPAEAEAFRAHLQSCAVCREELASLAPVVDALPMSAPQLATPKRLRRRVLTTVRREARARGTSPGPSLSDRLSLRQPAIALGAVVAAAVIAFGAIELGGSGQNTAARVYRAQVTTPGATAEVSIAGGQAQLIVHHLPAPATGHIYEVWVARPGRAPTPTGALFSVPASGNSAIALPGNLRGVRLVMVTAEPNGGTRAPTTAPLISAKLS